MTTRVTAARTQVLTILPPPEGVRVSTVRAQTLRSSLLNLKRKTSTTVNVLVGDQPPAGGQGEFSVHGYIAVATSVQGATSFINRGASAGPTNLAGWGTLPSFLQATPFATDYSANADPARLFRQFAGLYGPSTLLTSFNTDGSSLTYQYRIHALGPSTNDGQVVGQQPPDALPLEWRAGIYATTNVTTGQYFEGQAFTPGLNRVDSTWVQWQNDQFPCVLRGYELAYRIQQRTVNNLGAVVNDWSSRSFLWGFTPDGASEVKPATLPPRLPVIIRPGRGLYRVVKWNPGQVTIYNGSSEANETRIYPFPGRVTARLNEFVGRTFNGVDEFVRELYRRPYFTPGSPVDTKQMGLDYGDNLVAKGGGPLFWAGWTCLLDAGIGTGLEFTQQRDSFDDGRYLLDHYVDDFTSTFDVPRRFRRFKTLRLWASTRKNSPTLQGTLSNATVNPDTGVRVESFEWFPEADQPFPGTNIAADVTCPEFWLEKLDSPSTNFLSTDPLVDP